jgi:hypothetical protein
VARMEEMRHAYRVLVGKLEGGGGGGKDYLEDLGIAGLD